MTGALENMSMRRIVDAGDTVDHLTGQDAAAIARRASIGRPLASEPGAASHVSEKVHT
jgi:hypothetical protein